HAAPEVEEGVREAMAEGWTLMGSGTTPWEGRMAELLCECVPTLERVQVATTGSEATYHAIRLSRAFTGRDHLVVIQGGYNGWHDEVACNVMTPLKRLGPRTREGENPFVPLSAGTPSYVASRVHVVEFNDLEAVHRVFEAYPIACLITEPILQNVGVI